MKTPDQPANDPLHGQLAAHLEPVRASTDLTGPAIARAGRIRRRRRSLAAAGAAVATLAVASPFVWWSLQGDGPTPVPATTTTTATTATRAPTGTTSSIPTQTSAAPSATTPVAVPTGDADAAAIRVTIDPDAPMVARPELPFLLDATLHRGGTTTTLDAAPPLRYFSLAQGRSLVVEHPQGGSDLATVIDAGGQVLAELPATRGQYLTAAVSDAGTRFVLYDSSMQSSDLTATLAVFDGSGARIHEKRNVLSSIRIAGFVADRVFLASTSTGRSSVWDLERNSIDPYTEGLITAVHEQTGRAAIFSWATGVEEAPDSRCTTIADVTGDRPEPVSVTCGRFQPIEFSPDGGHLLGVETPGDGMLQAPSRIVDVATGRALVAFDEARPLDIDSGFLPDGSVALNLILAPVDSVEQNALMRCTVEGECTRLTETVPMPDFGTTMAPRYAIVRR